ncbi:MAG: hypothetical protein JNM44_10700 [Chitinophagaceae bacterium]|nr:hypothetical protein [Chitinophagaceae bacterium]
MKKLFTLALITFISSLTSLQATVRTVTNDGSGGSQYSSLLAAYNAAVNGDTLLLEGTNVQYNNYAGSIPNSPWNKSLTVIGIGFNPQKDHPRKTRIGNNAHTSYIAAGFYIGASGSGSRFYGIDFAVNVLSYGTLTNVLFEDCDFNGNYSFEGYSASGIAFVNCIFDADNANNVLVGGTGNSLTNVQFINCLFDGQINGSGNSIGGMLFDHCLFLNTAAPFTGLQNALVKNSIFMNASPSASNSSWINNISTQATVFHTGSGNSGSGNLYSTNPNFVNYTLGTFYANNHDYNVQSGSPAIGAANDGTDIGIHGGYSKFHESGEVLITPIIRSMTINQSNAAPGGTINVNIHASKPND